MNITEIQDLIKFVSKSGVTEVEITQKDFKITIKAEAAQGRRRGKAGQPEQVMQATVPMAMPQMQMPQAMPQTMPQPQQAQAPQSKEKAKEKEDETKYITVKSPMIGTFYRSAGPDKDAFVNVGDEIKPGKVICIIEAMKLFNEIEAEISGRIAKVLVDDSSPVEYDQPLFLVEPL